MIVWHKHNLMISSSVGSVGFFLTLASIHIRFPMNTYQGEGTSLGFGIFFQMVISLPHMLRIFQNSFIFGEATYSHFFWVTNSTQQLLFQSSCFFEELLFQNSHFFRSSYLFRTVTFPERNFYQAGTFWEEKVFRAVTFWNSYLFGGGIV